MGLWDQGLPGWGLSAWCLAGCGSNISLGKAVAGKSGNADTTSELDTVVKGLLICVSFPSLTVKWGGG